MLGPEGSSCGDARTQIEFETRVFFEKLDVYDNATTHSMLWTILLSPNCIYLYLPLDLEEKPLYDSILGTDERLTWKLGQQGNGKR